MSEPRPAPDAPSGARPSRGYQRSTGGLVGALIVTFLVVAGFVAVRAVTRDNEPTPVRTVDHTAMLRAGRADGKLAMLAPDRLPAGWRATSASYSTGVAPAWHLGMLTGGREYVGLEEARLSVGDLVRQHVDQHAERDGTASLSGERWEVWRDAGGDYGLARALTGKDGEPEAVLVVGTAPEAQIRAFAGSLHRG